MKTIAIFSIKGGVGKSAIAVNLAHLLSARSARRTLLWDLDAQGAASDILRAATSRHGARKLFAGKPNVDLGAHIEPSAYEGLDVLAADHSLRKLDAQLAETDRGKRLAKLLSGIAKDYDRVVLDCPPGLGLLAEQVFKAADLIVEPMTPSPLSASAHEQLEAHLARHNKGRPPILPVYTMVDRRRSLHRDVVGDSLAIPYASIVEQMAVHRLPSAEIDRRGAVTRAFVELATTVERRLLAAR